MISKVKYWIFLIKMKVTEYKMRNNDKYIY